MVGPLNRLPCERHRQLPQAETQQPPATTTPPSRRPTPTAMSQPSESYVTRLTRRLRESFEGEASDLTIICGEREWKVHKLVLCLNSDVFKKMLQGDFKESTQRKIELDKDDPDALNVLLRHIYAFNWLESLPAGVKAQNLILSMRVAKIADFYDVQSLQRTAVNAFRIDAQEVWGSQDFANAITEAYSNDGYDSFRDILVTTAAEQLTTFKSLKDFYKSFWTAVDTYHEFASALLRATPPVKSSTPFAPSAPFANKRPNESGNLPPPKRLSVAVGTPGVHNPFAAVATPQTGGGSNHPTPTHPPLRAVNNLSTSTGPPGAPPTGPPSTGPFQRGGLSSGVPRGDGIPRGGPRGGSSNRGCARGG